MTVVVIANAESIEDEHSELNVSDDEKEEERQGEDNDDDEEDEEDDDDEDEIVVREEDLFAAIPIEMCTCEEDELTNESNNNLGVDETSIIKETEVKEPIADLTAIDDQPTDEAPIKESSIGPVEEKGVPTVEKDGDSGVVADGRNENQSADPEDDDDEVCDDDDKDDGGDDGGDDDGGGGDDDGGDDGDDGDDDDDDGEDEVVDPMVAVKEKCGASPDCKPWAKKLESCNERLEEGDLMFHGETCTEELFGFVQCVAECASKYVHRMVV